MPFIQSLSYGTLFGGPFTSACAFQVSFSGNMAVEAELSDSILRIRNFPQGKGKLIRISGSFTEANELDVLTFIKSLKDSGYILQAHVDGQLHHAWFTLLDWLIVEVGDELWPGFACREFRYKLTSTSTGEEPIMPPNQDVMRYLVPEDDEARARVFSFIRSAKKPWGILSRKRFYMEV